MEKFFTIFKGAEDVSLRLKSFTTPSVPMALEAGDYLYVGFEKYFRTFFVGFDVLNTVAATISYEYFDGSTWAPLVVTDETFNFTKSGFVNFVPPTNWKATEVNGKSLIWVRISPSVDLTPTTKVSAVAILLSCDEDLEGVRKDIVSKYNKGKAWHEKHEEARKQIIQRIRNAGHRSVKQELNNSSLYFGYAQTLYFDEITEYDLLVPSELRQAAKYLALSLIYLNELSDSNDDKFERAGKHYYALYTEAVNLFMLKLDKNDNGLEDPEESDGYTQTSLVWP